MLKWGYTTTVSERQSAEQVNNSVCECKRKKILSEKYTYKRILLRKMQNEIDLSSNRTISTFNR